MKTRLYLILTPLFLAANLDVRCQNKTVALTLTRAVDSLALGSAAAKIEKLNFRNDLLAFENYKKSLLPSISLTLSPVSFNRSLRVLQQPADGNYYYVEDNSNNANAGITIKQKIGLTGGELNVGSSLNYLNEFTIKRNSFSTTPFSVGYSQQLFGGGRLFRFERGIEQAKKQISLKNYCTHLSEIQQQALNLFLTTLQAKLENELQLQNKQIDGELLELAKLKLDQGGIIEFDYKQIELQALNTQYACENSAKNYEEARRRLLAFLGLADIDVFPATPRFDLPLHIETSNAEFYVRKNNPFSLQQEIDRLQAEIDRYAAKLAARFNGSISLNYGFNQYAQTFAEAYRHANSRQSVSLGFQIPVFQWGINRNRARIAENTYQAIRLAAEKKRLDFDNDTQEKVSAYNHAVKLWITAEKAYALSQEQYKMLVKKFSLGKVSAYELATGQKDQNAALQRYYDALRAAYANYFALRHLALFDFRTGQELESLLTQGQE